MTASYREPQRRREERLLPVCASALSAEQLDAESTTTTTTSTAGTIRLGELTPKESTSPNKGENFTSPGVKLPQQERSKLRSMAEHRDVVENPHLCPPFLPCLPLRGSERLRSADRLPANRLASKQLHKLDEHLDGHEHHEEQPHRQQEHLRPPRQPRRTNRAPHFSTSWWSPAPPARDGCPFTARPFTARDGRRVLQPGTFRRRLTAPRRNC